MIIISNTSPLIFLTKIGRLSFLGGHQLSIPEQVLGEIKAWEEIDPENCQRLVAWIGKNKVSVEKATMAIDLPQSLGKGEKAAICLATQKKANAILIDEKKGRVAAKAAGLIPVGTIAIIRQQMLDKNITPQECKNLVLELINAVLHNYAVFAISVLMLSLFSSSMTLGRSLASFNSRTVIFFFV